MVDNIVIDWETLEAMEGIPSFAPALDHLNRSQIPSFTRVLRVAELHSKPKGIYQKTQFILEEGKLSFEKVNEILTLLKEMAADTKAMLPEEIERLTAAVEKLSDSSIEQMEILVGGVNAIVNETGLIHEAYDKGSRAITRFGNTLTGVGGVGTTAYSIARILISKNRIARWFYIVGASCGTIGGGLSAYAGIYSSNNCSSYCGEGLFLVGSGLLISAAGHVFVDTGDLLEGKRKKLQFPPLFGIKRGGSAYLYENPTNLAFTVPPTLKSIPYQKILTISLLILTVYSYAKFILAAYHRGKRLIGRYKSIKKSKLIQKQATYLCMASLKIKKFNKLANCNLG